MNVIQPQPSGSLHPGERRSRWATRFRIVTDELCGFSVQFRLWWLPIWIEANNWNSWSTIERAEAFAKEIMTGGEVMFRYPDGYKPKPNEMLTGTTAISATDRKTILRQVKKPAKFQKSVVKNL